MIVAMVVARKRERETTARIHTTQREGGKEMIFSFAFFVFGERYATQWSLHKFSKYNSSVAMPPDAPQAATPFRNQRAVASFSNQHLQRRRLKRTEPGDCRSRPRR